MISAHITQPLLTASQRVARENMERNLSPEFVGSETEAINHAIDHAMLADKINDPYRQRAADRASEREVQLRAAAGMVS